mmetsp:Transcript_95461/g.308076  ORF Transcript_95461/g.308076 Transcript_95461/m.308076 type:complete len:209 (-) Transcript_95461:229-855(-)
MLHAAARPTQKSPPPRPQGLAACPRPSGPAGRGPPRPRPAPKGSRLPRARPGRRAERAAAPDPGAGVAVARAPSERRAQHAVQHLPTPGRSRPARAAVSAARFVPRRPARRRKEGPGSGLRGARQPPVPRRHGGRPNGQRAGELHGRGCRWQPQRTALLLPVAGAPQQPLLPQAPAMLGATAVPHRWAGMPWWPSCTAAPMSPTGGAR